MSGQCLEETFDTEIPSAVHSLLDEYDSVIGHRDRFMWNWLNTVIKEFQHTCVPAEYETQAHTQKLRLAIFFTSIDDFNDRHSEDTLFETAAQIPNEAVSPTHELSGRKREQCQFMRSLWEELESALAEAPEYSPYRELFRYDVDDGIEATRHGSILSDLPEIGSYRVSIKREAPTMIMHALTDIDLMYSPDFDRDDLSEVRHATALVQPLARIGNWITTWERELAEGDCTNGVMMKALDESVVTPGEIRRLQSDGVHQEFKKDIADRVREAEIETRIKKDWQSRYDDARQRSWEAESTDIDAYVDSIRSVFEYQVRSRGLK